MSGLRDVVPALADSIRSNLELVGEWDVQVEPRYVFAPTPPTIDVYPSRTPARDAETAAMGDVSGGYFLTVRARVDTADTDAGQDLLYELADDEGDGSLAAAIYADDTLGGHASDVAIVEFSGWTLYPEFGEWLGFDFTVLVIAAKS